MSIHMEKKRRRRTQNSEKGRQEKEVWRILHRETFLVATMADDPRPRLCSVFLVGIRTHARKSNFLSKEIYIWTGALRLGLLNREEEEEADDGKVEKKKEERRKARERA